MRVRSYFGALLVAATLVVGTGSAAQAVNDVGPYQVVNYNSGLCLDVAHAGTDDFSQVIQYGCHHGSNQLWHFMANFGDAHFWIMPDHMWSRIPQGCTATISSSAAADAMIFGCDYVNNRPNFAWSLTPTGSSLPRPGSQFRYRFINAWSQMCLEVAGGSTSSGAHVRQAPCDGSLRQLWIVIP